MPSNPPSARQPGEAPSECDFCGGDDFTPPSAHAFDRGNVYCIRCGGLHGRNYAPGVAEVVAFTDAAQRAFGPPAAREPETRYVHVEGTPPTPTVTTTVYTDDVSCVLCGKKGGAMILNGTVAGYACWPYCAPQVVPMKADGTVDTEYYRLRIAEYAALLDLLRRVVAWYRGEGNELMADICADIEAATTNSASTGSSLGVRATLATETR